MPISLEGGVSVKTLKNSCLLQIDLKMQNLTCVSFHTFSNEKTILIFFPRSIQQKEHCFQIIFSEILLKLNYVS
jgi:hypothetical protein